LKVNIRNNPNMKNMKYLVTATLIISLFSCQLPSDKAKQEQEMDSLKMLTLDKDRQVNNLVTALIEIDENLQQIKEKEELITLNVSNAEDGGRSLEDRINSDIEVIYELMLKNKEQISSLEKQLKQSSSSNNNLSKLVKRLNAQLKDKTVEIIKMQQQLENQSLEITDLNFTIEGLQTVVDSLHSIKNATEQELTETVEQLYRAYYVFGTKKELKAENIISSDGFLTKKKVLAEGYSQDYFTSIDYRELDSLQLFMPKAKVLTNHPKSSYTLVPGADEALVLKISDKDSFWSMTKHLVIQVN